MYQLLDEVLSPYFDNLINSKRVDTALMQCHSIDDQLERLKRMSLIGSYGRTDIDLKGMITIVFPNILAGSNRNRVFVKNPDSRWFEVTNATGEEISALSMTVYPGEGPNNNLRVRAVRGFDRTEDVFRTLSAFGALRH